MSSIIKKIIIPNTDLPAIHTDGTFLIRYRVVSADGNKNSAWSIPQVISVPLTISSYTQGSITSDNIGINIGWKTDNLSTKQSFDVYLKWSYISGGTDLGSQSYVYVGNVKSNTYYTTIPTNGSSVKATYVGVLIQQETHVKTPSITNKVFEGNASTVATVVGLPSTFDGGVIT
jgi:hypothetical protein